MAGLGVTTEVSNKNHRRGYRWSQIERPPVWEQRATAATGTDYRRKEPVIMPRHAVPRNFKCVWLGLAAGPDSLS